jgi:hypothetical protein
VLPIECGGGRVLRVNDVLRLGLDAGPEIRPGFDQQHRPAGIFREPRRHHRSRGSGPDHNDVGFVSRVHDSSLTDLYAGFQTK